MRLLGTLWRALGSTRLAVILLAVLLLTLVLGGLFPQMPAGSDAQGPWVDAVTLRYGAATSLVRSLGLFDAFRSPWFLALLSALLLSLLSCTVRRLPGLWRSLDRPQAIARHEAFYEGFAYSAEWQVSSVEEGLAAAQVALARHRYRSRVEWGESATHASIHAEQGRWSQVGTLVSHLAAVALICAIAARPVLGWQESRVTLLPEQVHALGPRCPVEVMAGSPVVARHPDGQPKEYQVPLTLLEDNEIVVTRSVRLNHPLSYHGLSFHLQGLGPAVQVTAPEGTFGVALTGGQPQDVSLPQAGLSLNMALQPDEGTLFVEALTAGGDTLGSGTVVDGQKIEVAGIPLAFSLSEYTVWQVSHDPTVALALVAGFLMVGGMAVSLWIPFRQVWLRVDRDRVQMVGAGEFTVDRFETLADASSCGGLLEGESSG